MTDLFGVGDDDPMDRRDDDEAMDEKQWAPLLADMVRVVEALFLRKGMADEPAFALAKDVVLTEAEYFGGRQHYLPRGDRLRLALRDAEIWRKFTGRNVRELADEYSLSDIHTYAILKRQRALHSRRLQGRLFPD